MKIHSLRARLVDFQPPYSLLLAPMNYDVITHAQVKAVECKSTLAAVSDAVDLIAICAGQGTNRLILDSSVLPPTFFELQTRFAGELLQKLQNYRLRTAVIISPEADYGERFNEYLREAKHARFCRFFTSPEEALAWLSTGD
jgi:hypothetical protein